jgi:hypothetical protein
MICKFDKPKFSGVLYLNLRHLRQGHLISRKRSHNNGSHLVGQQAPCSSNLKMLCRQHDYTTAEKSPDLTLDDSERIRINWKFENVICYSFGEKGHYRNEVTNRNGYEDLSMVWTTNELAMNSWRLWTKQMTKLVPWSMNIWKSWKEQSLAAH